MSPVLGVVLTVVAVVVLFVPSMVLAVLVAVVEQRDRDSRRDFLAWQVGVSLFLAGASAAVSYVWLPAFFLTVLVWSGYWLLRAVAGGVRRVRRARLRRRDRVLLDEMERLFDV